MHELYMANMADKTIQLYSPADPAAKHVLERPALK